MRTTRLVRGIEAAANEEINLRLVTPGLSGTVPNVFAARAEVFNSAGQRLYTVSSSTQPRSFQLPEDGEVMIMVFDDGLADVGTYHISWA